MPLLERAIARFVCDVHERLPGGDHSIFTGADPPLRARAGAAARFLYFASSFDAG